MTKKFQMRRSLKLFKEAEKYLPAGANSSPRLWRGVCPTDMPCAIFAEKAVGSHIWDVDGNKYIDYRLGFGPVILGHSDKRVHDAVHKADEKGLVYALDNPWEIEVAKRICEMVPCAEKVRFANSGTEATMAALRVARGYTGKDKILKFEGHYHGSHDAVLFSAYPPFDWPRRKPEPMSLGIPGVLKSLTLVEEWNNFESVEATFRKHYRELAAIICEPVMGNAAVIPPADGFLKHLRELCDKYDVALIFDEVKTGFRLGKGGAQKYFHVTPDLAAFAKSLGNGYPIAAIAGIDDMMEMIGPNKVFHGGTYSGNPVSMVAAMTTLDILRKGRVYEHICDYGMKMMKGISKLFREHKICGLVQGFPGMFQFLFVNHEVMTYRDLKDCDMDLYADLQMELLRRGIMIDEDNEEPLYVCDAHSRKDLKETLEAFEGALTMPEIKRNFHQKRK